MGFGEICGVGRGVILLERPALGRNAQHSEARKYSLLANFDVLVLLKVVPDLVELADACCGHAASDQDFSSPALDSPLKPP